MKTPQTQTQEVLYKLIMYRTMTRADFFNECYILNAPARINDLRRLGIDITVEMKEAFNKFGRKCKYGVYTLIDREKAIEKYKQMQND